MATWADATDAQLGKALERQLAFGPPDQWPTLDAEILEEWIRQADRRLTGAAVVLNQRLKLPADHSLWERWNTLYHDKSRVMSALPFDNAWELAADLGCQAGEVYEQVMHKLGIRYYSPRRCRWVDPTKEEYDDPDASQASEREAV